MCNIQGVVRIGNNQNLIQCYLCHLLWQARWIIPIKITETFKPRVRQKRTKVASPTSKWAAISAKGACTARSGLIKSHPQFFLRFVKLRYNELMVFKILPFLVHKPLPYFLLVISNLLPSKPRQSSLHLVQIEHFLIRNDKQREVHLIKIELAVNNLLPTLRYRQPRFLHV